MILNKYTWQMLVMVVVMDGHNRTEGAPSRSTKIVTEKKIVTWKRLVSNYIDDSDEAAGDKYKYIINESNDILCTYALYAKTHFDLIYSIVTSGFNFEETRTIISNLHLSYFNVFLKQIATFYNAEYDEIRQIPEWMKFLRDRSILNTELSTKIKFRRVLSDILLILTNFVSNYGCDSFKLRSIITYPIKENELKNLRTTVIELINEDRQFANLYNEVVDFKNANLISVWLSSKFKTSDIQTSYKLSEEKYEFDNSNEENTVQPPDTIRICGKYMFSYLKYIALEVYNNIVEINYLLKKNSHKLKYSNYKIFANIHSDTVQETLDKNESIMPKTFIERYKLTISNSAYSAELLNAKRLEINVRTIMNIKLLKSIEKDKLIALISENNTKTGVYDKRYYRYQTAKLETIMNTIMTDLHCTYTYFARMHFEKIINYLIVYSKKNDVYYRDNLNLINKYYKISLQTLASIFHYQYRAPNWMIMVAVYFERLLIQLGKNYNDFMNETLNVLIVLNWHNNQCKNPKTYTIAIPEKTNNKLTEEILKDMSSDYLRDNIYKKNKNLNSMFSNLKLFMFLLDSNKKYLPCYNYNKFEPINWVFSFDNLNKNAIQILTFNHFGENQDNSQYLVKKLQESKKEPYIYKRIKNYINLHDTVVNLIQTRMVLYVVHFMTHCKYLFFLLRKNYLNVVIEDQEAYLKEYNKMCSGFPKHFMQINVNEYNVFDDIIKENYDVIINEHMESMSEEQSQIEMFNKSYRLLMKKQNQFLINSLILDGENPNFVKYLNVIKQKKTDKNVISTFITHIQLQINGLKTNARRYFVSLMKTIRFYNFDIYNMIFKSIGSMRPFADYHD